MDPPVIPRIGRVGYVRCTPEILGEGRSRTHHTHEYEAAEADDEDIPRTSTGHPVTPAATTKAIIWAQRDTRYDLLNKILVSFHLLLPFFFRAKTCSYVRFFTNGGSWSTKKAGEKDNCCFLALGSLR